MDLQRSISNAIRPNYYRLDENKNPVPCEFAEMEESFIHPEKRLIKKTEFKETLNNILVSTVFLSIAHGFDENDLPILFETMTFGLERYRELYPMIRRSSTYQEALELHEASVQLVKTILGPYFLTSEASSV